MKRIHVFLFVVLMLIVAMALCTVIFAACNSPLSDDIEGIEIGVAAMADTSAMPSQTTSVTSFASLL